MLQTGFIALCLSLAALLSGCSSSSPRGTGVSQATLDADYAECESMSYVSTAGIRAEGAANDKRQELIDTCMQNKGYTVQ